MGGWVCAQNATKENTGVEDYRILYATTLDGLQEEVNKALADGYVLRGPLVASAPEHRLPIFAQVVTTPQDRWEPVDNDDDTE
jgi:hypothetical protein